MFLKEREVLEVYSLPRGGRNRASAAMCERHLRVPESQLHPTTRTWMWWCQGRCEDHTALLRNHKITCCTSMPPFGGPCLTGPLPEQEIFPFSLLNHCVLLDSAAHCQPHTWPQLSAGEPIVWPSMQHAISRRVERATVHLRADRARLRT